MPVLADSEFDRSRSETRQDNFSNYTLAMRGQFAIPSKSDAVRPIVKSKNEEIGEHYKIAKSFHFREPAIDH